MSRPVRHQVAGGVGPVVPVRSDGCGAQQRSDPIDAVLESKLCDCV